MPIHRYPEIGGALNSFRGTANGGLFASLGDGTVDWLNNSALNLPNSKLITMSLWATFEGTAGSEYYIFNANNLNSLKFFLKSGGQTRCHGKSSGSYVFNWESATAELGTSFFHYALSIDAGSAIYQARANGADVSSGFNNLSDAVMDFTGAFTCFSGIGGANKANVKISELWIKSGVQIDLDTDIDDFYGGGIPPYLGAVGELPGGAGQPHIYSRDGGATNLGTLGNFTENGSLELVPGPGAA